MKNREEALRAMLGKAVHVVVDRPIGYHHKGLVYPVNYGFHPGIMAGDGEEQDVYILGVDAPLAEFHGRVIGAVLRRDDCEDKLVAAPEGTYFSRAQIAEAVHFQEQFFDSVVIV